MTLLSGAPRCGTRHRKRGLPELCSLRIRGLLGDVMSRDLLTVAPEDTLGEAAEKMAGRGVGAALVMDFGRLVGILTERDLLAAVAGRVQTSEARVREWMTKTLSRFARRRRSEEPRASWRRTAFATCRSSTVTGTIGIISLRDVVRSVVREYPEYEDEEEEEE
jgi:signal-transduction protein with cAMP-binding, CBS, and nucleotidyltransferase domain